mmetsp:Transcript_11902/g.21914  ORF Transcript_11902/g.21914 Transcript_11902/m.21914 type:complete len:710 (+) Transcript_11902:723-2852(+)|eukprot:CAMPEP_0203751288 /NCGR_PEP_ID=MMETSP0098-20131031/5384_1 /ASSEMBLY_ACC=CAM_ASM_000208 /TAXON_ID=96639 /ORGANISM=" , Strain NY0313808BC1" /LENGTH=709 /DNA_ID=CAMNT_0050640943 /DNA_START=497 /DNA_END=2626 /DNA_ORIENTATION=-
MEGIGDDAGMEMIEHKFKVKTYLTPTKCGLCKKMLVGIVDQGLQCSVCEFNCHKKCKDKVNRLVECVHYDALRFTPSQTDGEVIDFPHSFNATTFTKPTDCAVCDKLLVGLFKQGVRCTVCGVCVHQKCKITSNTTHPCALQATKDLDSSQRGTDKSDEYTLTEDELALIGSAQDQLGDLGPLDVESTMPRKPLLSIDPIPAGGAGKTMDISPQHTILDSDDGANASILRHNFSEVTFGKPTDCDHCGKLLLGIYKQGSKCSTCGVACHQKCIAAANEHVLCCPSNKLGSNSPTKRVALLDVNGNAVTPDERGAPPPPPPRTDLDDTISSLQKQASQHLDVLKQRLDKVDEDLEKWTDEKTEQLGVLGEELSEKLKEADLEFEKWKVETGKTMGELSDRAGQKADEVDKSLDDHFNKYNDSVQKAFERIEKDGVANTVTRNLRSGTDFVVEKLVRMSSIKEKQPQGKQVEVDEEVMDSMKTIAKGAKKVGEVSIDVANAIKDAAVDGIHFIAETDTAKEIDANTDPEVKKALASGFAGIGQVASGVAESIERVGAATGDAATRIATHEYGEEVGSVTRSTMDIAGAGYYTYATAASIATGTCLVSAPVRTGHRWTMSEKTVFQEAMYRKVYDMLEIDANLYRTAVPMALQKEVGKTLDVINAGKETTVVETPVGAGEHVRRESVEASMVMDDDSEFHFDYNEYMSTKQA